MSDDLPYLDAFPPGDDAQWRARVETALKGKSADTLGSQTYDGIPIAPLYPPATNAVPVCDKRGWAVLARADAPDAESAAVQALDDLGNGADGLHVVMAGALGDYGSGLQAGQLDATLADVVLDAEVPIELDALDTGEAARALAAVVAGRNALAETTRITFGVDPFGALARGRVRDLAPARAGLADLARDLEARGFQGSVFVADTRLVHAAGGSEAQELAWALSAALGILRLLDEAGIAPAEARAKISFRVAVDADEFLGIAKLRALRKLWAAVEAGCGVTPTPVAIHAETAWRNLTRRDPDVNMIRATVSVFAAAAGGADRISVLPHTQALGVPDAFARRVARNAQLVLREEANLDKVADPAAGSGGFEALTDALCEQGWAAFQAIEAAGGLEVVIADGSFATAVAGVAASRAKNVARRRDAITGVSEFAALSEIVPPQPGPATTPAAFAPRRLAEPFEALRDRSDAQLAATGARPKVYLATLGPPASFAARKTFAKNLFEAGGFETIAHDGIDAPAALADGYRQSGAAIACLCAADATYAEHAGPAAAALAKAGAHVAMAGRAGAREAEWREAGVRDFAYAGADVVALLEALSAIA